MFIHVQGLSENNHRTFIHNTWKQCKHPSEVEWVNKMCYIYAMEHFMTMKKRTVIGATTWLNCKDIMLRERSQT